MAASKPPSVDAYLAALEHHFKGEVLAIRRIVRAVDPAVGAWETT